MAVGDRGESIGGTPHAPNVDPRAVTTAGQTLSPPKPEVSPQSVNGTWGPIPQMGHGLTFREIGSSGLRQFSGWVREEFLQQLVGRQGAQKYREMLDNSPIVNALMMTFQATMRKVDWRVLPANDSGEAQEAADFVDSCRTDMSHTWEELIMENLSMLGYGFASHELVYKKRNGRNPGMDPQRPGKQLAKSDYDDGLIGWRRLPIRSQDTVIKWFFDENGETEGLTQQPWVGPLIDIPIEKLLLFRAGVHKSNPEGRSILRSAYVPYYFVKRLQEQEAILFERMGGIPLVKIPSQVFTLADGGDGKAAAALAMYKQIVTNMRVDEQMGVVLPSDVWPGTTGQGTSTPMYSFELVTPQIGAARLSHDTTISRYNTSILTSVLADFLTLGHESRGTQSLAVSKVDMFFQAIEGYLNSMAAIYNRHAIPRLWGLNGFDFDLMPSIEPDMAQRVDLDVLSNFILRLSQAGMPLFPNDELQSYILDAGGMPDIQDDRALQAAGLQDDQLDTQDAKDQQALQNMQQPKAIPQPGGSPGGGKLLGGAKPPSNPGNSPLEKMLLASLARRQIRMAGPKFGIRSGAVAKRQKHSHKVA